MLHKHVVKFSFSCFSGLCAATASIFGKLSGLPILEGYIILRIICFACMITANGAVWTFFAKALQQTDSLTATVVSSATNYMVSAVAGSLLFGEVTSLLWWSGMFMIIAGVLLIVSNESITKDNSANKIK